MSSLLTRLILIGVLVPVGAIGSAKATKKRIAKYHITQIDEPIMFKCTSLMSGRDVTFAKGASNADGCACIAKHATSSIENGKLPVFTETLEVTLDLAKSTMGESSKQAVADFNAFSNAAERYTKIQKKAKMSDKQYTELTSKVMDYVGTCGNRETHKGESLTRIAALSPLSAPRAKPSSVARIDVKPKKTDKEVAQMLR